MQSNDINEAYEKWLKIFSEERPDIVFNKFGEDLPSHAYTAGARMVKEGVVDIIISERTNQKRLSKLREFNIEIDIELGKARK